MTLLENDQFLADLAKLFQKGRSSGVIVITMKRYDGRTKPKPKTEVVHPHQPVEYKCLFRAKIGNKKISTVVTAKEVNKFQLAYANVLKANMDALKKRERRAAKEKRVGVSSSSRAGGFDAQAWTT
ncbi:unnamed protein product [Soboliphyme baturini]|uniref:Signal recognition particle 14 kDa protein n=1 Tax=Soboliphyme baturini TaxID=241478 RepID=A0A183IUW5_9BILA|nr:unnamed protein product [Soboliphyme baturini]